MKAIEARRESKKGIINKFFYFFKEVGRYLVHLFILFIKIFFPTAKKNRRIYDEFEKKIEKKSKKLQRKIIPKIQSIKQKLQQKNRTKIFELIDCSKAFIKQKKLIITFKIIQRLQSFITSYSHAYLLEKSVDKLNRYWISLHDSKKILDIYLSSMGDRYYKKERFEKAKRLYIMAKEVMKHVTEGYMLTRLIQVYINEIERCDRGIKIKKAKRFYARGCRLQEGLENSKAVDHFIKARNLLESIPKEHRERDLLNMVKARLLIAPKNFN